VAIVQGRVQVKCSHCGGQYLVVSD
jgi:hypothetical protein